MCVCEKWFAKFRSGDFNVEDLPHFGRLTEVDSSVIKNFVYENISPSVQEIAAAFK